MGVVCTQAQLQLKRFLEMAPWYNRAMEFYRMLAAQHGSDYSCGLRRDLFFRVSKFKKNKVPPTHNALLTPQCMPAFCSACSQRIWVYIPSTHAAIPYLKSVFLRQAMHLPTVPGVGFHPNQLDALHAHDRRRACGCRPGQRRRHRRTVEPSNLARNVRRLGRAW
jgi:hypothetical protein